MIPTVPLHRHWLSAIAFIAILLSQVTARDLQQDLASAKAYKDYMNLQRALIDAKFHPSESRRASAQTHTTTFTKETANADPKKLHEALKDAGAQRANIVRLLSVRESLYQKKTFSAETEIAALERQELSTGETREARNEKIAKLRADLTWAKKHRDFNAQEKRAIAGELSNARQLLELYEKHIQLEETKIEATAEADSRAVGEIGGITDIEVEFQTSDLVGQTLAATRQKLEGRPLSQANRMIEQKLSPVLKQIKRTRSENTVEMQRLQSLKALYETERAELKSLHESRPAESRSR